MESKPRDMKAELLHIMETVCPNCRKDVASPLSEEDND